MNDISRLDILCPFREYEKLKSRYTKRNIVADKWCPDEFYYYWSVRFDRITAVRVEDGSVWVCDLERGYPWLKRVR